MTLPDLETIISAINESADYAETGDLTKANAFVSACKRYALFVPVDSRQGNRHGTTMDPKLIAQMAREAQAYIDARSSGAGGSVYHPDLSELRGPGW